VIAHRGGAGIAPENTLVAFRKSVELGVDFLELDIHASKDGELIVIHDESIDRTTNGNGLVSSKTRDELQKLDAGYTWTNDDGKTFPYRGKGVKLSILREVFQTFPEIRINIEAKHSEPSPATPLCDLIREFKRTDKVIVASTVSSFLAEFRRECQGVATSASPAEAIGFFVRYKVGLSDNYSPEMQVLQTIPKFRAFQIVSANYIKAAHERNLQVHVWTINKKEDMQNLIEIGVDGIMTDYPDRLLETLRKAETRQ